MASLTWHWDERKGKRHRGKAALWRRGGRLAAVAVAAFVALAAVVAVVDWGLDHGCSRTSPGAVERTVGSFQARIAGADWARACGLLSHRLRHEYAGIGGGHCAPGLRSAAAQGAVRAAPITTNKVNSVQTQAKVRTRDAQYRLIKPQ